MKNAVIIRTDGTTSVIDIESDSLKQLQYAVGGWVQAIDLSPTRTMWVNEEGKLTGLPHNIFAQVFWDNAYGVGTDIIVGDVVLTGGVDSQGETLGLADADVELAQQVASPATI